MLCLLMKCVKVNLEELCPAFFDLLFFNLFFFFVLIVFLNLIACFDQTHRSTNRRQSYIQLQLLSHAAAAAAGDANVAAVVAVVHPLQLALFPHQAMHLASHFG